MTIGEAIAGFEQRWVAGQAMTPRTAYERTLRLLAFWLESAGRSASDELETLLPADLDAFVHWHAANALADDADGSRKVALHVARLGSHLAGACDRPDLDLGRARLRAQV
ncbi:MAG: hypothetical protein QOJ07_1505 [Thermoleophilaceae bacterium]|nr:hypothetical protein [Thermoleophilaceae bacterium]